jgi:SRSO17 transposase
LTSQRQNNQYYQANNSFEKSFYTASIQLIVLQNNQWRKTVSFRWEEHPL